MSTQHTHRPRTADRQTYGWTRCVAAPGARCDGRSHGAATHVDVCRCGATRRTESNGRHEERGEWEAATAPVAERYYASASGMAFTGGSAGYRARVDGDGAVRVWDSVAGHWTLAHALTETQQAHIRARAVAK